jgi:uncharacterized protein
MVIVQEAAETFASMHRSVRVGRRRRSREQHVGKTVVVPLAMLVPKVFSNRPTKMSIARPAANATVSGRKADSPCAIESAFTNSLTASAPRRRRGAVVLLPAPLGPQTTTTRGSFIGPARLGIAGTITCLMPLKEQGGWIIVDVQVVPRASRTAVGPMVGDRLRVAVTSPPVDGAANAAVIEAVAAAFGVRRAAVEIIRGERGRRKTVRIASTTRDVLERILGTPLQS